MPASTVLQPLKYSVKQAAFYNSTRRFNTAPCGRRSGKTAIAKRRLRKKALLHQGNPGDRYIAGGPTHAQAKRIFWEDVKQLFPPILRLPGKQGVSESELSIRLLNGAIVEVVGLDEPARAEGAPIRHIVLDEFANMKPEVWTDHLRPTLTDTEGTADIIGAPEGRNHYYELCLQSEGDTTGEWGHHTWWTEEVLPLYLGSEQAALEIASARATMDEMTFNQEYRAAFIAFAGLAYYAWSRALHAKERVYYDPRFPLQLCFDFNTSPGVAVIAQERPYQGNNPAVTDWVTAVIGEVFIPKNSTTPMVCNRILKDWGDHKGEVELYGDSTGGARTTSSVDGSDWDIITDRLGQRFGGRLINRVTTNPAERARVNAVNSRLQSSTGAVSLIVDPINCKNLIKDFEGTTVVQGGSGEIDKRKDSKRWSHITDALGYNIHGRHPVVRETGGVSIQTF